MVPAIAPITEPALTPELEVAVELAAIALPALEDEALRPAVVVTYEVPATVLLATFADEEVVAAAAVELALVDELDEELEVLVLEVVLDEVLVEELVEEVVAEVLDVVEVAEEVVEVVVLVVLAEVVVSAFEVVIAAAAVVPVEAAALVVPVEIPTIESKILSRLR